MLDTHVLIWVTQGDARLGSTAGQKIEETAISSTIMVPEICVWEAALAERRGRLDVTGGTIAWIRAVLDAPAFMLAHLEPEIAVDAAIMEWDHRDPADRMIVATARHWRCPLLTADRAILAYAAQGHVHAIDARQ